MAQSLQMEFSNFKNLDRSISESRCELNIVAKLKVYFQQYLLLPLIYIRQV